MTAEPLLMKTPGCEFFVPVVKKDVPQLTEAALLKAASDYEMPSKEYEGATIRFSVLDGKPQTADYFLHGSLYARTVFKDGLPVFRTMDRDGDGIFETSEAFGTDPSNRMGLTPEERNQVMTDVFGQPSDNSAGIYVKMLQIDRHGDTVPDYTEEYLADGGKILSWDYDGDGFWDVRFVKYPHRAGEPQLEDALFYTVPEHTLITVSSVDGEPVRVASGDRQYTVTAGDSQRFYWIGGKGTPQAEQAAANGLDRIADQGVCILVQGSGFRVRAVRIGQRIFGQVLQETENGETGNNNAKQK
jgi:hypothetical protein